MNNEKNTSSPSSAGRSTSGTASSTATGRQDVATYEIQGLQSSIFKGRIDAEEAEDWFRELEKFFKIMRCTDEGKVLLA